MGEQFLRSEYREQKQEQEQENQMVKTKKVPSGRGLIIIKDYWKVLSQ